MIPQFYDIGFVKRAKGVNGAMRIVVYSEWRSSFGALDFIYMQVNGDYVPFFFASRVSDHNDEWLVTFEDINSREAVKNLTTSKILVSNHDLNRLDIEPEYKSVLGLEGYQIINEGDNLSYHIEQIELLEGQVLATITHDGKEYLIPMARPLIKEIDHKGMLIHMDLPEGLLDL